MIRILIYSLFAVHAMGQGSVDRMRDADLASLKPSDLPDFSAAVTGGRFSSGVLKTERRAVSVEQYYRAALHGEGIADLRYYLLPDVDESPLALLVDTRVGPPDAPASVNVDVEGWYFLRFDLVDTVLVVVIQNHQDGAEVGAVTWERKRG